MNQEIDQDRVFDTFDHFKKFGFVMFKQNRRVYENVAERIKGKDVLEAGCGMGLGSALLERNAKSIVSTDKLPNNVKFAKELYGWIDFDVWDISDPTQRKAESVVCLETIEHVAQFKNAIRHLKQAATKEVWISTPNSDEETPSNPFHVTEFRPNQMLEMLGNAKIYHWDTMEELSPDTLESPLIYHLVL